MREDDNRAGVRVNNPFKKILAMNLGDKLRDNLVYFHKNFLCIGDDYTNEDMKGEIIDQLLNFSRIIKPSKDIHRPPTEIYSGKSGHGFDDHVIALMLNLVMMGRFFTRREAYSKWYGE